MQLTDLPIAMLYILAVASVGIYGIVLAGWSSGSTYPLLGGLRSCAQMISYEIAMGAAFASVFLYSGLDVDLGRSSTQQHDRWYVVLLPVSFLIYIVTMVGETNRAPFDMPESEGDLVGGFNTEYSSIKFALFMLAEYVNMVTVSAVSVTLFLGGWRAPYPISTFWEGANHGWWPMLWFVIKVQLLLFFFIWLRGTLPARPLRPADEARLEGPHPGLAGLADAASRPYGRCATRTTTSPTSPSTSAAASSPCCCSPSSSTSSATGAKAGAGGRSRARRLRPDGGRVPRTAAARTGRCRRCRAGVRAVSAS